MSRAQSFQMPLHAEITVFYTWTSAGPEDIYLNLGRVQVDDLDSIDIPTQDEVWEAVQNDWQNVVWDQQAVAL